MLTNLYFCEVRNFRVLLYKHRQNILILFLFGNVDITHLCFLFKISVEMLLKIRSFTLYGNIFSINLCT